MTSAKELEVKQIKSITFTPGSVKTTIESTVEVEQTLSDDDIAKTLTVAIENISEETKATTGLADTVNVATQVNCEYILLQNGHGYSALYPANHNFFNFT